MTIPASLRMNTQVGALGDRHEPDRLSDKDGFRILSGQAGPEAFGRVLGDPTFAEIESHPRTGAFGRAYYPAVHGNQDCSFAVYVLQAWFCDAYRGQYRLALAIAVVQHG